MFVQRRTIRHDYKLIFVQRRAPRRDYTIVFVQQRAPRRQSYDTSHRRNGRGGACVPARTSAQRRFHPQKRRFQLPSLRSHLQMWHFQLTSPPYIIGQGGVYILRHLIIYINHARTLLSMLHHAATLCFPWCDAFQPRHCMCFMA